MNNCSFNGRLTKDPELMTAQQSGKAYLKFCLAVKRRTKSDHPTSDFIDCIAWDKTAELISEYCSKGSQIGVVGRLQTDTYEKDGEKRKSYVIFVNEFDLLGGKRSGSSETAATAEETTPNFEPSLPFEV